MTTQAAPHDGKRLIRVLSIDGGGIRGIIPAIFVAEIERRCGKPAWQLFDVIAGTSTGALVTGFLTRPDPYSGDGVVDYYSGPRADHFFRRSLLYRLRSLDGFLRPKYPASTHVGALREALGDTAELKDLLTDVAIPMFDLKSRAPRTFVFTREAARRDPERNFPLWKVVRAASTASGSYPGWLMASASGKIAHHPVDGGIYVNNPAIEGLSHAVEMNGGVDAVAAGEIDVLMVSLGTGYHDEPLDTRHERHWGFLGWAPHLMDLMFEGQAEAAHCHAREMLPASGLFRHYLRLQAVLPAPYKLDDIAPEVRRELVAAAERTVAEQSADIDRICGELG